jgi:type IV pilus assembly protein PilC
MPNFQYTAIDQQGREKSGSIDASDKEDAIDKIINMGLMPSDIKGDKAAAGKKAKSKKSSGKKGFSFGSPIKHEQLTTFTRQLATLLQAGLPLLRSIEVMGRQERNPAFKEILVSIADSVKSGTSFSDSLAMFPKIFDRLYINMIKAGEAGGVLDTVLSRLASFMEKSVKTKKKIQSAMIYPAVVLSVAVLIVVMLMIVVVPKFQGIFKDMLKGAPLPLPTQIVINISDFIKGNFFVFAGMIALVVFAFILFKRTAFGTRFLNKLAITIPKLGDLNRMGNISRFSRTFGTLLSSGVPILQSLNITREILSNYFYSKAVGAIHDAVRDGEPLAAPMERESVFPTMVTSMIEIGEETGQLAEMLNRVADNYDEDVDNAVAGLTSIIEPVMIVFLAVVVGFIVIALFLPIVGIIENLS